MKGNRLSIFVDDAVTNEPIPDATVQVTIGEAAAVEATKEPDGSYAAALPEPRPTGSVEVIFAIAAKKGDDLLVDSFTLSQNAVALARDERRWVSAGPVGAALVLAALSLGLAFRFLKRRRRTVAATSAAVAASACVVLAAVSFGEWRSTAADAGKPPPPPALSDAPRRLQDGSAFAAKTTQRLLDIRTASAEPKSVRPALTLIGRVIANPDRSSIVQSVYGGRVVPSEIAIPRIGQEVRKGDVLIRIEPHLPVADRTTILEKVGEIEQLIAVAENKIRRLRPLAERGAVPQGQVNDLESELEGLRARRETVRNSRSDHEVLRASTDGIITTAKVVPGQVIQPQDVLYQIADPKGLWVEALAYGDIDLNAPVEATAVASNGQSIPLSHLGTSRALRQHASVVHFAIPEAPAGLNIGQPLTVMVQNGTPTEGLIFPRDSVVRSGAGESIVWVHVAPERFEPRPVRVLPVDATRVIVAAGLGGGERVVVRGTDLVNQIR
ncbi:efflux RND transporter periplasmic adaptor subunit [Bradyrhizobium sp. 190]|uniref:efflux RND transporter periplasmic adaptor subunit n=1 Tax=Bradyrhizobium sp. 190 TaxID=2782658 RepID=UPI001FFA1F58|nr:efflux RND transporter periplasmic adaptor subunit [Bradyrhizobium sp. 190]